MCTSHDLQHGQHDDGLNRDGDELAGLSGFVILRLSRQLAAGDGPDLREHLKALQLGSLDEYLDELKQPPTRRVITSLEPRVLLQLEEQTMNSSRPPLNSLARYWRIDGRGLGQPVEELVQRFSQLEGVELAYAEMIVSDPTVNAAIDPLNAQQGYLDAAPNGIDARWAWMQPSGKGQGVGVVDVEMGWRIRHEDLRSKAPTLIRNGPAHLINRDGTGGYIGHHGTAVMGVIAAGDNDHGVIGIAPSLGSLRAASIFDGVDAVHVADALTAAWQSMAGGDVLVLEVQRGVGPHALPTETDTVDFDAIRLATLHGVIVVEAAGNGDHNLNEWRDETGRRRLFRGHPDFLEMDSGAIMVGACQSAVVDGIGHARFPTSNYGSRIDCYAWGENVTTSGYDDASPDTSYTSSFNGTSSATAIITGAAVLTQSMNRAKTRNPLSPDQMRNILSNRATGTPQSTSPPAPPGNIGSMPDLQRIGMNVLGRIR
jgi:hypothetical protein